MRLKQDLQGTPTLYLEQIEPKKSIATTRSFNTNYTEIEQLEERIATFAVSCAEKLRKQKVCCNSMMVFIKTNQHRKELSQYSRSIVIQLPFSTNSSIEIAKFAKLALHKIFIKGFAYKKAGVVIQDFTDENKTQINLFENSNQRHKKLMESMDGLNTIYGQQKIKIGSQDLKKVWKMKQEKLSPCYSTKLKDVITIAV